MKPKALWILLAFLIWGSGSTYWYVCKIKGFCKQTEVVDKATPNKDAQDATSVQVKKQTPKRLRELLSFDWSSDKPVIKDDNQWKAEVKSIAQLKAEGKKLRIEAPYYADETNHTSFDNLGLARAHQVKEMFAKVLDSNLILTGSKLMTFKDSVHPDFMNAYKGYISWVTDNDFVKERFGKTLIYFPYNSTKEIKNKNILDYLNNLVAKLKEHPNQKVSLTGYTDNVGNQASNVKLGLKRANRIKSILMKKGIESNRILTDSKGKDNPIADNATKEGRQQNRRVEITIIK